MKFDSHAKKHELIPCLRNDAKCYVAILQKSSSNILNLKLTHLNGLNVTMKKEKELYLVSSVASAESTNFKLKLVIK